MPDETEVTLATVQAAAEVLAGQVVRTPLARSQTLGAITGADVFVKFEQLRSSMRCASTWRSRRSSPRVPGRPPWPRSSSTLCCSPADAVEVLAVVAGLQNAGFTCAVADARAVGTG